MPKFRGTKENLNTKFTTSELRGIASHWKVPLGTGSQKLTRKSDILDAVFNKLQQKNRRGAAQGQEIWFSKEPDPQRRGQVVIGTAWENKEGPPRVPERGEVGGRRKPAPGAAPSREGEGDRGGPPRKQKRKRGAREAGTGRVAGSREWSSQTFFIMQHGIGRNKRISARKVQAEGAK